MQFIHSEKSSGLYQVNHISHHADALGLEIFKKFLKQKSHNFLIQFNYFKSRVIQLYARGPNKDRKMFSGFQQALRTACTHGNSPIATRRSCLQEQSGFVVVSDGIRRLCMLRKKCFLVLLCFKSLFTNCP